MEPDAEVDECSRAAWRAQESAANRRSSGALSDGKGMQDALLKHHRYVGDACDAQQAVLTWPGSKPSVTGQHIQMSEVLGSCCAELSSFSKLRVLSS